MLQGQRTDPGIHTVVGRSGCCRVRVALKVVRLGPSSNLAPLHEPPAGHPKPQLPPSELCLELDSGTSLPCDKQELPAPQRDMASSPGPYTSQRLQGSPSCRGCVDYNCWKGTEPASRTAGFFSHQPPWGPLQYVPSGEGRFTVCVYERASSNLHYIYAILCQ